MTRRALWVTPVSNLAGVSRKILDAAREGIPGYSLTVAAPAGPLLDRLGQLSVPTHVLPLDRSPVHAVRQLRGIIQELKPAVVHTHLARADFLVPAAAFGLPTHLVSSEHGIAADDRLYHSGRAKSLIRRGLHHARSRRYDALIAVSESTKREMIRAWRPTPPIHVVLNGVDRPQCPHREPGTRFLSLARLAPEKRIPDTLRAFARLAGDLPTATLTVAGDGPARAEAVSLTHDLGLAERVTFPGYLEPQDALADHDVLVQLSAWENASYSVLDAVVHGLGVVATPVGGNPEILPAHCMAEGDDVERVAELLREQALEVDRRTTLPRNWPSVADMTAQIAGVYEEVVG